MYDYQSNDLIEEINQKIKFFTKEKYFKLFSYMLTEKSKNFSAFKKVSSLVLFIDNLEKEKKIKNSKILSIVKKEEKNYINSLWFYLMMHICNVPNKKKYLKQRKNELDIDPIIYSYMVNLCQNKIKLLNHFSITHQINMNCLVKFYLDNCLNIIIQEKENIKNNEMDEQNSIDNNYYIINFNNKFPYKRRSKLKLNLNLNYSSSNNKNKINFKFQKNLQIAPKRNSKIKINNLLQFKDKREKKQINYSRSFTRLFIGETDHKSVIDRYFSNIVIKKIKQLHLVNKKINLSSLYLKKLYHKISRNENNIDYEMNVLFNKFKIDAKTVENFKRNALSFDKKQSEVNYIDKDKEKLQKQLDKQINVYSKPISIRNKFHTFNKISKFSFSPENKFLMNLKNSRNKLYINYKKNKNHSFLFNSSSDYNSGFSLIYSRNETKNLSGLKMSFTNNSKTNSLIKSKFSKHNIKINLNHSPVSKFKFETKNNNIYKDNDLFINLKTKLYKENEHFHFKNKKYLFNSSM